MRRAVASTREFHSWPRPTERRPDDRPDRGSPGGHNRSAPPVEGAPFTSGGYQWSIARLLPVTAQTTVKANGDQLDAPVGRVYFAATLLLKNSTSEQEPGLKLNQLNVTLGVPAVAAAIIGWAYSSTLAGRSRDVPFPQPYVVSKNGRRLL